MQQGNSARQTAAALLAGAAGEFESRGQQSGSEYVPESEGDSDSNSSSLASEDCALSDAEGSDSDAEAEIECRQQRRSAVRHRQSNRGDVTSARADGAIVEPASADAAAAAAAAGAGAEQSAGCPQQLHPPYSNLLWSESALKRGKLPVSCQLCTDIGGVSSSGAGAPVQVTLVVHEASWDVQQHIRRQLQLDVLAGQQQAQSSGAAANTPVKEFGPYAATLQQRGTNLRINHLQQQHEQITTWQYMAGKPHTILLQERVPGPNTPHFKLHLRPGRSSQPRNGYARAISRAGEAPGLQVVPGSVTEVTNVCITRRRGQDAGVLIPKALACSQLPADATFPLPVTLTVAGEGRWEVNLSQWLSSGKVHVKCCCSQALSAFAGRSISRMSLSQGRQLVITLAQAAPPPATAAAAAAAAAAQRTSLRVQQASHHTMAAAGRESATARAAPSNLAVPSTPTTAQVVAARSQPQSGLPLKRRTGENAEPGTRSDQHQVKIGSTVAAVAPATIGGVAMAPAAAPAGPSVQPAAARKKVKRAAQQAPAAAVAGAGVEAAMDGRPMSAPPQPLLRNAGIPAAAAAAAAGPRPIAAITASIKLEAPTVPATQPAAVNRPGQAAQQGPAALAGTPMAGAGTPGAVPGAAAAAAAAVAADPSPPPVAPVPIKVEAPEVMDLTADDEDSGTAAAAAAAEAAASQQAAGRLPAGLRLASASSLTAMEDELLKLMTEGLMPLLPAQQYVHMMRQLQQLFDESVDVAVLQRKYKYVQAAVMGRQVVAVVEALQALFKACGG